MKIEYGEHATNINQDKVDQMDKFLERRKLPKLAQKEIGHLEKPIISDQTELVIQKLPTKKTQAQMEHC